MPTYEYQATGGDGKVVSGLEFGPSLDSAAKQLQSRGMEVLRIGLAATASDPLIKAATQPARTEKPAATSEVVGPPVEPRSYMATSVVGPVVGKVNLTELAFFFRQLATMLEAGVPFVQSLDTLGGQSKSLKMRHIVQELKGHVEAGRPISAGLQRYPEVFTPVMVSLIRAGEKGGFLDRALGIVADYTDQELKLRNLYQRLTFYPKLQVVASIVIIVAANLMLASLGSSTRLSSPLTTPSTYIGLVPLAIGLFLYFRVGLANPRIKHTWDRIITNLPYLGHTLRQLAMAKFGRSFGALYRGAVPIPDAVKLSADACGNEWLRSRMYPAAARLEGGAGIAETFKATGAFSPIVLDMVDTGERTGELDLMLLKMAEFYEGEAETRSTQTAYVTGVLLGLCVAAYILIFILLPFWTNYADTVKSYSQ